MQHKSFLILSIFLSFFIANAMEERTYRVASMQLANPNIHQSHSASYFTQERSEEFKKKIQESEQSPNQKAFEYQKYIRAHLKATVAGDLTYLDTLHETHKKKIIKESIQELPKQIQIFLNRIKLKTQTGDNIYENSPHQFLNLNFLSFFSPSETLNNSIANIIPQYCNLPYTIIECSKLPNKYINSEKSKLQEIFSSLLNISFSQVIVLNNLDAVIKNYNGEKDESTAHTLCDFIDIIEKRKNILVITTANKLSELPTRLRQRLYKNEIKLPTCQNRIDNIIAHINKTQQKVPYNITFPDIEYLARKTNGFSSIDLYRMLTEARKNANKRHEKNKKIDKKATLTITNNDILKSFSCIKKNYNIAQPWYTTPHAIFTPLIIPALHIGIPLAVLLYQAKQT